MIDFNEETPLTVLLDRVHLLSNGFKIGFSTVNGEIQTAESEGKRAKEDVVLYIRNLTERWTSREADILRSIETLKASTKLLREASTADEQLEALSAINIVVLCGASVYPGSYEPDPPPRDVVRSRSRSCPSVAVSVNGVVARMESALGVDIAAGGNTVSEAIAALVVLALKDSLLFLEEEQKDLVIIQSVLTQPVLTQSELTQRAKSFKYDEGFFHRIYGSGQDLPVER